MWSIIIMPSLVFRTAEDPAIQDEPVRMLRANFFCNYLQMLICYEWWRGDFSLTTDCLHNSYPGAANCAWLRHSHFSIWEIWDVTVTDLFNIALTESRHTEVGYVRKLRPKCLGGELSEYKKSISWEWRTMGVADLGSGGSWEWRTLGVVGRHRVTQ